MGYCVDYDICDVKIIASRVQECLVAVNENSSTHQPTLVEAFIHWRFSAHEDEEGSVILDYFNGEKLRDEETLFATIAPFVAGRGEIYGHGEDGARWKNVLANGRMRTFTGRTVYEDDQGGN